MSLRISLSLFLVLLVASLHAMAEDTTYRDPREPSFTLLVPDGWDLQQTDNGVMLSHDDAYLRLIVLGDARTPGSMLVQFRSQIEPQWEGFREVDAGRLTLGGHDGVYGQYQGVPPSGIPSQVRVAATTNGQLSYVLFSGVTDARTGELGPELMRIEQSFAPDPVP